MSSALVMGAPNDSCSFTGTPLSWFVVTNQGLLYSFFFWFLCVVSFYVLNVEYKFVFHIIYYNFAVHNMSFKTIHLLVKLCSIDNTYHLLFSWRCTIQLKPDRGDGRFSCKVAHKTFESSISVWVWVFLFFSAVTLEMCCFFFKLQHATKIFSLNCLLKPFI